MSVISALLNCEKIYNFSDAFGVKDITTREMKTAIKLWLEMYFDHESDGLDDCQRLPVLVVNKLIKTTFSEYETSTKNAFAERVLGELEEIRREAFQPARISGNDNRRWQILYFARAQDGRASFNDRNKALSVKRLKHARRGSPTRHARKICEFRACGGVAR